MNALSLSILSLFTVLAIAPMACQDSTDAQKEESRQNLDFTPREEQKLAQDNEFTLSLFSEALGSLEEGDNILMSPVSASLALAMLHNGAEGETKQAISKALKFEGFSDEEINTYYQKIIQTLPNLDPNTTLDIANSIWYRQEFKAHSSFLDINRSFYHAEISALDFSGPQAPKTINDWVSKNTNGKIPTIVDDISSDMVMYLINAIYFKGSWQEKFDTERTRQMPFKRSNGSDLQTDFMNIQEKFNIVQNNDVQGIELPYGDGQFSMFVFMPTENTDVKELIKKFDDSEFLANVYSGFSKRETNLSIPKFKFAYENTLNDELDRMGMGVVFTDQADLSGIADDDLLVSEVKQKAFIEVNEEGTEAAAVTGVGVSVTSMPMVQTLTFDKPFFFLIRENNCGLILFTGAVNDPSKEETKN